MVQRELSFETAKLSRVHVEVRDILSAGNWLSAEDVRAELERRGFPVSGSTATARIRDLRQPACGTLTVVCKRVAGVYRYRIL